MERFVIYSRSESDATEAGFWSNKDGWVDFTQADVFSEVEKAAFSLPHSAGMDAVWMPRFEAEKLYSTAAPVSFQVKADFSLYLRGVSPEEMQDRLQNVIEKAFENGTITGGTNAEVVRYGVTTHLAPVAASEDEMTNFMKFRLENSEWESDDIPVRLARFGLMDPIDFVNEMRERMETSGFRDPVDTLIDAFFDVAVEQSQLLSTLFKEVFRAKGDKARLDVLLAEQCDELAGYIGAQAANEVIEEDRQDDMIYKAESFVAEVIRPNQFKSLAAVLWLNGVGKGSEMIRNAIS